MVSAKSRNVAQNLSPFANAALGNAKIVSCCTKYIYAACAGAWHP